LYLGSVIFLKKLFVKTEKKWIPLFATNFLGVFNNNFLRNLIAFTCLSIFFEKDKEWIVTLASGLYVLPYIFFSPLGGRLAKIRRKSSIMFWCKFSELIVFACACFSFAFHNIYIALACVFSVGVISTLFSPSKYGLIRDIGGNEGISFGTGMLEMFTFLGVLLGTFTASIISDHYSVVVFSCTLIGVSLMQLISSRMLKGVQETKTMEVDNDTLNPALFLYRSFRWGLTIKNSNIIIFGLATFWVLGNLIVMNLLVHCNKVLNMTNTETGFVMNISGLGIGLGSMITGLLSRKKVQLGFTPLGAFGAVISLTLLYILKPAGAEFSFFIFLISFFCGMYMVPLSSWVQHSVGGRLQGDMLAYSNFVIFFLMVVSSFVYGWFVKTFDTNMAWLLMIFLLVIVQLFMLIRIKGMIPKVLEVLGLKQPEQNT
jgi:MFS family permease